MFLALGAVSVASGGVTTLRFDLPTNPLGIFGLQFSQDFVVDVAKIRDMGIVETRVHLEFNTVAAAGDIDDAATLQIDFQPPVEGLEELILQVTGADFGWSGQGKFVGDLTTDFLNAPILDFPPDAELSLWFFRVINNDDADPFLGGQLSNSFIEVDVLPVSSAEPGDCDGDGDVDLADFGEFQLCFTGPVGGPVDEACDCANFDADGDVDLADFASFQLAFTGPL
jgi:hypothetical protein